MNKKILVFGMIGLFVMVLASAAVLQYFGFTSRNVVVTEATSFTGDTNYDLVAIAGETSSSEDMNIESLTTVNAPLSIVTTISPEAEETTHTPVFVLSASGTPVGQDSMVYIDASDVSVSTLSDLGTISWDVNVTDGYIAHVDVRLDNGETLVFEYAKVDPTNCDDAVDYPDGEVNTFGDKGIVDNDAYAWLSSGVPGPCGNSTFDENHKSLTNWKTTWGSVSVIGFDLEVDNWIEDSTSEVKNILINGNPIEITLKPKEDLSFRVETEFPLDITNGTYTVNTTVELR